uniref:Uncharacterized protein n=1 Tax=Sphaerodactylus townsendi TaxID=933632 RepID=A0ACB8EL03_9SAUR
MLHLKCRNMYMVWCCHKRMVTWIMEVGKNDKLRISFFFNVQVIKHESEKYACCSETRVESRGRHRLNARPSQAKPSVQLRTQPGQVSFKLQASEVEPTV